MDADYECGGKCETEIFYMHTKMKNILDKFMIFIYVYKQSLFTIFNQV